MKKYDALYIFVGIAKDDVLEANLEKALTEVTRLGGNVLEKVQLGKRVFSRPMKKRESGVYVKVRLELDPAKVDELVKRYKLVEEVFRVQVLAVDDRREAKIAQERAERAEIQAKKDAAAAAALAAKAEVAEEQGKGGADMASFNKVILMGGLVRDPEVQSTGATGVKVARMRLSVTEQRKDRNGVLQKFPVYVDVDAWDKLAELCGQYLTKGRSILVEGRLQMDSWEKDGVKHQKLKVRASTIKFLPQGDRLAGGSKAVEPVAVSVPEGDPDDIPF